VGWGEWLSRHGLTLRAADFREAGLWVTPASLPVRFAARFYLLALPPGEVAESWPGEVAEGGWVRPEEALARWERGEALLHPPQLHAFRVMAAFAGHEQAAAALRSEPGTPDGVPRSIEFQRGIRGLPLATATLPPASHTTCYLVGHGELLVVDPGTDTEEELLRLEEALARLAAEGCRVKAVVLTHHHGDHASGGRAVAERLGVPVWCHRLTAERLGLTPGRLLEEGDGLTLAGSPPMHLTVLHTPGHAPGHVCLVEEQSGAALVGDMVAGVGTILIDPADGDMGEYLAQLERLRDRPVRTLYPAHGPALPDAPATLQGYIAHRLAREERVLAAVEVEGSALADIVARAYDDTPPFLHPLAERSTLAHLLKLEREGQLVRSAPERWQRTPSPQGEGRGEGDVHPRT
jgi:glyoxylase-like metal-dependent hydrolase (beta-lactamase superfamily II)